MNDNRYWFIVLFIILFLGVLLWSYKIPSSLTTKTAVTQSKLLNDQQPIPDRGEISPNISFKKSGKEALHAPSFILQATTSTKALITINSKPCQWFYIGDTLIRHYTLHSIDSTLVTIFDGKGAYYEITLNDAPMEEEVFEDDENTVAQDTPNTKGMINLGDGQYIFYGDRDVSGDTEEETFDQASQVVDTSDQTIIYGDEDVSQQVESEQDLNSKYVQ